MLKKLESILLLLSLILILYGCVGTMTMTGSSMEPTLKDGDNVAVTTSAFKNSAPSRGDIVLFEYEGTKGVSRVIRLPTDKITRKDGNVYINGNELDENYLAPGTKTESKTEEYEVSENSYFVMSYNRLHSQDSRQIGFIPRDKILAKVDK